MRIQIALLSLLVCLIASPVGAQTNPVPAGQSFTGAFDHPGVNVTGFRCYVGTLKVGADLPASARSCVYPGQSVGAHEVAVAAFNAFGESPKLTATVTVGTPPATPTNFTITVQVAVMPGTNDVRLLAASVAREP